MGATHLRLNRNVITAQIEYDPDAVQAIKTVPGYAWDATTKQWKFPMDAVCVTGLHEIMSKFGPVKLDPALQVWWEHERERMARILAARTEESPVLMAPWRSKLHPFQRVGVNFMATAGNALLTDDMGLGKTLESLTAVTELICQGKVDTEGPFLVVTLNSVKGSWVKEIEQWLGQPATILDKCNDKEWGDRKGWYVINWDKLHLRMDTLTDMPWQVIIGDESHAMINRKSKRTKAMVTLGKHSKYRFLLSGTPMRNDVAELWPQLHFLEPWRFTSYWKFVDRYVNVVEDFFGNKKNVGPKEENRAELRQILDTLVFGRKLDEVELELPPLTHKTIRVELGKRQRKVYKEMEEQFVAWVDDLQEDEIKASGWLPQVLRLKQIAGSLGIFSDEHKDSAKLDALFDLLGQVPASEKFVIMSQFRTMVEETCSRLRAEGVSYARMDGEHTEVWTEGDEVESFKLRQDLVDRFQNDDKVRVFISTTQTGGTGLTLTSARYFAFLDLLWVPGDNDQAFKRIHRISQKRACFVYTFMARDTVDYSAILPTLKRKSAIIKAVLGREDQDQD